jgi:hypothetical protein
MNYDHYDGLRFTEDYDFFLFYSEGPKGSLKKLVIYTPVKALQNGYNLGFGTLKTDEDGAEYLDGNEISDNGDRNKILATIAITADTFLTNYPDRKIYLTGSNNARTRLYQMAINHAFEELCEIFEIYGDISEEEGSYNLQQFRAGINYTGFVVEKR